MTRRVTLTTLVELADGDRDLVTLLIEEGVIVEDDGGFAPEQVDRVLVSRTLVREFDVNIAGVDIILRLRHQLAAARRRLVELGEPADAADDPTQPDPGE